MTLFSFIYQKKVRDLFWQALVLGLTLGLLVFFILNASRNMREAGIASGFDFGQAPREAAFVSAHRGLAEQSTVNRGLIYLIYLGALAIPIGLLVWAAVRARRRPAACEGVGR